MVDHLPTVVEQVADLGACLEAIREGDVKIQENQVVKTVLLATASLLTLDGLLDVLQHLETVLGRLNCEPVGLKQRAY